MIYTNFVISEKIRKCCTENSEVTENTGDLFICGNQTSARYQVYADSFNNTEGECTDSNTNGFFVYNLHKGKILSKNPIKATYQKCCPLQHTYNPLHRSCTKETNLTEGYLPYSLIKIGLPHCKVILDTKLENLDAVEKYFEDVRDENFCLDKNSQGGYIVRRCEDDLKVCEERRCIKKCCPDGQSFYNGGFCKDTFVHGLKLEEQYYSDFIEDVTDEYELIYGTKCPQVSLLRKNTIQYTITKNGKFRYYYNFSESFLEEDWSEFKNYCLEHATKGSTSGYHIFMCYSKEVPEKFTFTLWAKILSCVFLVITVGIYVYLDEIKSTFGKILISYCLTMFCLITTLIVSHLHLSSLKIDCKIRAYLIIFLNLSAFAWVNIMSLDIWWTFSTSKRAIGSDQRRKDLKKYLLYCLYGWGLPLCHLVLIITLEQTEILPNVIHPYIGVYYCIIEDRNYARILFLLVPQLVFQVINTVLFVKTIVYCVRVKNEINKMNHSSKSTESQKFSVNKERLILIIKLAIIMGFFWIFEVTTAFFSNMKKYSTFTKQLEVIFDNITCLQGIYIFIIFICKKKTLNRIKSKMSRVNQKFAGAYMTQSSQTNSITKVYPIQKRQTTMSITLSE